MEEVEAVGAVEGAGLTAGGDVEPVGFFSMTRFSGSLKQEQDTNNIHLSIDFLTHPTLNHGCRGLEPIPACTDREACL